MSSHEIEIIKIHKILEHPNADRLQIIEICEFICCVRKGDWEIGDLVAYIPPDYVVPVDREEFSFLKKKEEHTKERIRVKKLRGVMSQGLIVPAPKASLEGDDVREFLGIERYVPKMKGEPGFIKGGNYIKGPPGNAPKYDLENWRKYSRLMVDGETVVLTEKLHGANARFRFSEGEMFCGSRPRWVANDGKNSWSAALAQAPWLAAFCENHPEFTVYGEIYGWVQDLRYGRSRGQISFRAFDLLLGNKWVDAQELLNYFRDNAEIVVDGVHLLSVPAITQAPYSRDLILEHVDGQSLIPNADHVREGIVIKPIRERRDMRLGRVALKCVSNEYLSRGNR